MLDLQFFRIEGHEDLALDTAVELVQSSRRRSLPCRKAFGESAVDGRENIAGFLPVAAIAPEPDRSRCRAQLRPNPQNAADHATLAMRDNFH